MSSYLPVYAALRAIFMSVGLEWLTNPVLAALSLLALAALTRKLWPEDPWKPLLAVALLAASPQFLVMSMTSYAMPAHLALNLIWLWLYADPYQTPLLAGSPGLASPRSVCINPSFTPSSPLRFSCGSHSRDGGGQLFGTRPCISWGSPAGMPGGSIFSYAAFRHFPERLRSLITALFSSRASISRSCWVGWPFLFRCSRFSALSRLRQQPPLIQDAAASCFLTFGFYIFVQLDQAHGWGDRYFHGALGCLILLSLVGWDALVDRIGKRAAFAFVVVGLGAAVLLQLPVRCYEAERFVWPFRARVRCLSRNG